MSLSFTIYYILNGALFFVSSRHYGKCKDKDSNRNYIVLITGIARDLCGVWQ